MNYVSIDLETTGLLPDRCMILSIAAVIDGYDFRQVPVNELPHIELLIDNGDLLTGQPVALAMNADIIKRIENLKKCQRDERALTRYVFSPDQAMDMLAAFMDPYLDDKKLTPAGKQYGSFDSQFIKHWGGDRVLKKLHHRSLDPGAMYATREMRCPPSSEECFKIMVNECNAHMVDHVTASWKQHDALSDARNVVRLIRHKWGSGIL